MSEMHSSSMTKFYDLIEKASYYDFYEEIYPLPSGPIECTPQEDLESEKQKASDPQERKKQKKKEYKKRKRQKERSQESNLVVMEEQAKLELAKIIQQIYCQRATFQEKKTRIQICLSYMDRGDRFHSFLSQVIRIHVNSVQRETWEFTHKLLKLHPVKENDSSTLYYEFATCLCLGYEHICLATIHIKKIIRSFMLRTENKDYLGPKYRNYKSLERDTFAYLIESDLYLKSLIRICQKKLYTKTELPKEHFEEITKLIILVDDLEIDIGYQSEMEEYEESTETSLEDEQLCSFVAEEKQESYISPGNGKKRRRKTKEYDLNQNFQDILERVQNIKIEFDSRKPCNVEEQWLRKIDKEIACKVKPRKRE